MLAIGVREEHHELVAADACDQVGGPKARPQAVRDGAEHRVARGMAVRVVHGLESVEVEVGQRQRAAVAPRRIHLSLRLVLEPPEVGEAGELIGARELPLSRRCASLRRATAIATTANTPMRVAAFQKGSRPVEVDTSPVRLTTEQAIAVMMPAARPTYAVTSQMGAR